MRGRFFIKIDLTAVCFTQADESDGVTANHEDDTKKSLTKQTVSDEAVFAVIAPLVFICECYSDSQTAAPKTGGLSVNLKKVRVSTLRARGLSPQRRK